MISLPPLPPAAAAQLLLARRRARSSLEAFTIYTKPDYHANWHHQLLCRYLDRFASGELRRIMVFMPPQHGKALALDTLIPTPTGFTTMAEIAVGDVVFDDRGIPCRVIAVSPVWKDRPVWRVTDDTGNDVMADANHIWLVRLDRKWKCWTLRTTEFLAQRTCKRNPMVKLQGSLQLPDAKLPIDPYVLGVWLGDGCSDHATITQGDQDYEFVRHQVELAGYVTSDRATDGTFGALGLSAPLRRAGLLGNKHIPAAYLRASAAQRLVLLQGLVDTDGHVAPDGQIELCSVKAGLASQIQELVFSLGCKASVILGTASVNGKDCGPKYRVMFYMAGAARLPRKVSRCRDAAKKPNRYIRFEPAGLADTRCIQVDSPSGMFLCGRAMLPTHNSELVSRRLPAYLLGRNPDARIIACSYSADLASRMNRDVQRIIDSESFPSLFPETQLYGRNNRSNADGAYLRNSDLFEIVGYRGSYRSAGIGGGITGMGMDYGVIDDPLKNREEADSPTVREAIWEWYTSTFYSRRSRDCGILITMTRWNEDDLAGRLLALARDNPQADQWTVLRLPAVCEEPKHEEDPREYGEALWPERYPLAELEKTKANSIYEWQALYQQNPRPEGGTEWPRSYLEGDDLWFDEWPDDLTIRVMSLDPSKGREAKFGDFSAWVMLGRDREGILYVEADLARRPTTQIVKDGLELAHRFSPQGVAIETNAFQELLAVEFARQSQAQGIRLPIFGVVNMTNKLVRIRRLGPYLAARNIRFRAGSPGTKLLVQQLRDFPIADHDDAPDSLEQGLRLAIYLHNGRRGGGEGISCLRAA